MKTESLIVLVKQRSSIARSVSRGIFVPGAGVKQYQPAELAGNPNRPFGDCHSSCADCDIRSAAYTARRRATHKRDETQTARYPRSRFSAVTIQRDVDFR